MHTNGFKLKFEIVQRSLYLSLIKIIGTRFHNLKLLTKLKLLIFDKYVKFIRQIKTTKIKVFKIDPIIRYLHDAI